MKKPEIEPLLYEDEEGNVIGLDEVQLLEPVPTERIPKVRLLLDKESVSILSQLLKNQDSSVSHRHRRRIPQRTNRPSTNFICHIRQQI